MKRCLAHSLLPYSSGCILIVSPNVVSHVWGGLSSILLGTDRRIAFRRLQDQLVVCSFGTSAKLTAHCHSFIRCVTNVQKTEVWIFPNCLGLSQQPLSARYPLFGCTVGLAVAWAAGLVHKLPVLCEFSEHSRCILWSIVTDKCVRYAV